MKQLKTLKQIRILHFKNINKTWFIKKFNFILCSFTISVFLLMTIRSSYLNHASVSKVLDIQIIKYLRNDSIYFCG